MVAGTFSFLSTLSERLSEWASNPWFLGVIVAVALLDAVVPVVPSETTLILAGVAISTNQAPYHLLTAMACGAIGAWVGDNVAYTIGRRFSPPIQRWAARHPRFASKLDWAERQIARRGGPLLITARFIPGGRTALTVANGITRSPRAAFMIWTAIAAVIWATFSAGLAYLVGKPFQDHHVAALWVAFGTALAINVVVEVVRHRIAKRRRPLPDGGE